MKNYKEVTENFWTVYTSKGLTSAKSFLRKENIKFSVETINFGWQTSKCAREQKGNFLTCKRRKGEIAVHYYGEATRAKNGFSVNSLRGQLITFTL